MGTDDGGLWEKMIGVDVIKVGMGIDQEADGFVGNSTDLRQQALAMAALVKLSTTITSSSPTITPALL